MTTLLVLALFFGAAAVVRNPSAPRMLRVLAMTFVVTVFAEAVWFALIFTGTLRLDWLTRWLGTPKLQRPWDAIALFGPAMIAGAVYFVVAISSSE
jgi:hypothetical protein